MKSLAIFLVVGLCGCASASKQPQGAGCDSPLGFIPEGQNATGYLHPLEQNQTSCLQGTLTCANGAWSGAYIYPTCVRAP